MYSYNVTMYCVLLLGSAGFRHCSTSQISNQILKHYSNRNESIIVLDRRQFSEKSLLHEPYRVELGLLL